MRLSHIVRGILTGLSISCATASLASTAVELNCSGKPSDLSPEARAFVAALPADMFWNTIQLPEDRTKPYGTQLNIFYYGRLVPGKTPVMYFNGGPADDSHSSFAQLEHLRQSMPPDQQVSFIYMDQRGTGFSTPYPSGTDSLVARRLLNYGSRNIVLDAEAIRSRLLGNQPWEIYGASFGGNIVARYLTLAPQSLTAAVSFSGMVRMDLQTAKERALMQQNGWTKYLAIHPEDDAKVKQLRAGIPADHVIQLPAGRSVVGAGGVDLIALGIGFQAWDLMHGSINQMIDATGKVSLDAYDQIVKQFLGLNSFGESLPEVVISWKDAQGGKSDAQISTLALQALKEDGINTDNWTVSEMRLNATIQGPQIESVVAQLPPREIDPIDIGKVAASLRRHPHLLYYALAAENDAFIPSTSVARFAAHLKNQLPENASDQVKFTTLPGVGHEAQTQSKTIMNVLVSLAGRTTSFSSCMNSNH